jgi:hypothetical protein
MPNRNRPYRLRLRWAKHWEDTVRTFASLERALAVAQDQAECYPEYTAYKVEYEVSRGPLAACGQFTRDDEERVSLLPDGPG